MSAALDGNAIVWCDGAFATPNGKTAHGLVRKTRRYKVVGVLDAACAGRDAGEVLEGKPRGIPVLRDLPAALAHAASIGAPATHLVIGLAPDGGRLPPHGRAAVKAALEAGLNVDSGLHDFLSEDPELAALAAARGRTLRDIRRCPPRSELHFFSGRIEEVRSTVVAVLGTDSAVGKRTTSWMLVDAYNARGVRAELIGTGQTAWLQGARYGILLDGLINDFVSGELEHAVVSAWDEQRPRVLVVEGQGSLMNPAYPSGLEILAAARPKQIVLQHAPARAEYDGFPGYPIHPIERQIQAVEVLSDAKVVAITVNHENLSSHEIDAACAELTARTGLPAVDPLVHGTDAVLEALHLHE